MRKGAFRMTEVSEREYVALEQIGLVVADISVRNNQTKRMAGWQDGYRHHNQPAFRFRQAHAQLV